MSKNKRDFGSFHSSNVQELVELEDDSYEPPCLPFAIPDFLEERKTFQFGNACRKTHFLLEDECTFLNHGAFGCVLKEALDVSQKWQRYIERQPLRFFDRELLPHLVHVTRRLAKFVGCEPRNLVLMTNVTTAINTVVRSLDLRKGEVVYILSTTYGVVKKLLKWVCEQTGAVLQEEEVKYPITGQDQIIALVNETLKAGTKLAVFDHIPSNTPVILPVDELIQICHQRKVPVLIDGAHALGTIPLQLEKSDPDYYVSNGHKWFCSPKGCAFLYVRKELQSRTRPLVISHGFGSGFSSEFIWTGLHDYSPFLALHVILNFWENIGPAKVRGYMYDLCKSACNMLTKKWGTHLAAPEDMFGSMGLVALPTEVYMSSKNVDYNIAEEIQNELYHKYDIEVPVKAVQGHLYVRISAHVYNELSEYERLGDAVMHIATANASHVPVSAKKSKLSGNNSSCT